MDQPLMGWIIVGGLLIGLIWMVWQFSRRVDRAVHEIEQGTEARTASFAQMWEQRLGDTVKHNAQLVTGTQQHVSESIQQMSKALTEVSRELGQQSVWNKQLLEVGQKLDEFQQLLRAPKFRGEVGEEMLGNLLRQILPAACFEEQFTFCDGQKVDAIIKIGDHLLPIDAKFPIDQFKRMLVATDEKGSKAARREFIQQIKRHIEDIASKYIRPAEGTVDCAFMYIPLESVYYELIIKGQQAEELEGVTEYARKKRVYAVSPNTLFPYLSIVLFGLRGLAVEERAKVILQRMTQMQQWHRDLESILETLQGHLRNAQGSLDHARKKVTRLGTGLEALAPVQAEEASQLLEAASEKSEK